MQPRVIKAKGLEFAQKKIATIVIFSIVFFTQAFFHQKHFDNAMALARLDLLHSIVFHGTIWIDNYHTNTPDKAFSGKHYYCDKAPGIVFLAIPCFYLASRILPTFGVSRDSDKNWLLLSWVSTVGSVGVISAIGCACFFSWLIRFVPPQTSLISSLVLAFGTISFPYSTMLLSHGAVIGLIATSMALVEAGMQRIDSPISTHQAFQFKDLAGGALCGLAVACEFSATLVVIGLIICQFGLNRSRGISMVIGSIPSLSLIPIYNWLCFGDPFKLPYGSEAVFLELNEGFFGIGTPDSSRAFQWLFSFNRGLFVWSPFLLFSLIGFPKLFRISPKLFFLSSIISTLHITVMSGFFDTNAGWTLGPRFLAPIVPLLMIPSAIGASIYPKTTIFIALISILSTGVATIIDAQLPWRVENPIYNFYMPKLINGEFTHNLGNLVGLNSYWSILPLVIINMLGIYFLYRRTHAP